MPSPILQTTNITKSFAVSFFYGITASLFSFPRPMEVDKLALTQHANEQREHTSITLQNRDEQARGSHLGASEKEVVSDSNNNMTNPNAIDSKEGLPLFFSEEAAHSGPPAGLTATGRRAEGDQIAQVDTRKGALFKKEDSPDSIMISTSKARGAEKDLAATKKKISFASPLIEDEEDEKEKNLVFAASSKKATELAQEIKKPSKRLLKKIVTKMELKIREIDPEDPQYSDKVTAIYESADDKIKPALKEHLPLIQQDDKTLKSIVAVYAEADPEIRTHLRSLLASLERESNSSEQGDSCLFAIKLLEISFFLADIKAETDLIPEDDPERFGKVAAHYQAAYLKRRAELQTALSSMEDRNLEQDKNAILNLGVMALEVAELAFRSTDLEKMKPIKVEECLTYPSMTERQIPWGNVSSEGVEESDEQALLIIEEAHKLIDNMKNTMKALSASDANAPFFLHRSHLLKAHSIIELAMTKNFTAKRKLELLYLQSPPSSSELLSQALKSQQVAANNEQKCRDHVSDLASHYDPVTAKNIAVTDMLSLIQSLLEKDSQLITVLSRIE